MKCPYLIIPIIPTCLANEKPYMPSTVQLQQYCKTKYCTRCPFFRTSIKKMKQHREKSASL